MERRRAERERELESDARDRQKEKEELEELKTKIFSEGHTDPSATYKQVSSAYSRQNLKLMTIRVPSSFGSTNYGNFNCITTSYLQALYEREQQYKPKIILPTKPASESSGRPFSPMDVSLPSQPSDAEEFPLTKQQLNHSAAASLSSAPSTPTGPEPKTNSSSVSSSIVAMEEDSMSTSASISPAPTESDSKQSNAPLSASSAKFNFTFAFFL